MALAQYGADGSNFRTGQISIHLQLSAGQLTLPACAFRYACCAQAWFCGKGKISFLYRVDAPG